MGGFSGGFFKGIKVSVTGAGWAESVAATDDGKEHECLRQRNFQRGLNTGLGKAAAVFGETGVKERQRPAEAGVAGCA